MDKLNSHIKELEGKINSLHQLVERIDTKVNNLSDCKKTTIEPYSIGSVDGYGERSGTGLESSHSMSHKDILTDDAGRDRNSTTQEKDLAPEIQIRRLTAQLTAAYNRIAALEEQLLTYRIKS